MYVGTHQAVQLTLLTTSCPTLFMHTTKNHTQVATPAPLPNGMGIEILDCAGGQLSMVTAGTIAAFRVSLC